MGGGAGGGGSVNHEGVECLRVSLGPDISPCRAPEGLG